MVDREGLRGVAAPAGTNREAAVLVPRHVVALETALRLAHAALVALADAPASEADLRPIAKALGRVVTETCSGYDGAADPLTGVRDAVVALDEARELLVSAVEIDPPLGEIVAWLDNARGWLLVAEERQSRVVPQPLEPMPLRASRDEPTLHHIPRARLVPGLKVADPKPPPRSAAPRVERPRPKSIEELEATIARIKTDSEEDRVALMRATLVRKRLLELEKEREAERPLDPPPGFTRPRTRAWTALRFVETRCRECFEEVAMLGLQRAPLLGDPWRGAQFMERRMLASIDAIAALGADALAALEPMVLDAPAKDPSRGFGVTMIAGCFVGRDTLAVAERVLRHLGARSPDVARAVAGALKLVPHPDLPHMLRAWGQDPDPGFRAIAIDVLSYRGLITSDEITAAATDPAPAVRAAALMAAGILRVDELDDLVAKSIEDEDAEVRGATCWAMILGGTQHAADRVERELTGKHEDRALLPLALGASERHAETIAERLEAGLTSARILAAGWAGSPRAFPALLAGLGHGDPELSLGCALALDRITGANLLERLEIAPEHIEVADDVDDPDVGEPEERSLAREVSDPRDVPSDGSPDLMNLPTTRRSRWEAYFAAEPTRYNPKLRYRRGLPYMPRTSLLELDRYALVEGERRLLQRELVVRTGEHVRFDPHDFVAVQERTLPEWSIPANKASSLPGSWVRPPRARR